MNEAQNTKIVKDAYAAFGRGDVPALLSLFSDDINWNAVYGTGPHVPTSGVRHGKAAVGEFFKQLAANIFFSRFEPREFIATGDKVVALGHYAATTTTGRGFDSDFAMVFTITGGKVTAFQEFCNSAAINAAF